MNKNELKLYNKYKSDLDFQMKYMSEKELKRKYNNLIGITEGKRNVRIRAFLSFVRLNGLNDEKKIKHLCLQLAKIIKEYMDKNGI